MNNLQIGVTGGIGSGKSLVCEIFARLRIPVYNADQRARWLMNNHDQLKAEIIEIFGLETYDENGIINRSYLAGKVFNNSDELAKLNDLVHPAVGVDYLSWQQKQTSPYTIKEAALMFESGSYKGLDYVINVSAPRELRVRRILKRDPFRSESEITAIIDKQLTDNERIERSDFSIVNDDQEMVIPQVILLNAFFVKGKK